MFGREKWSLNARGHNLDKIRSEILWPGFAQILRADPRAEPWRGNQIPTRSHWGEGEGRRQGCPHALGAKVRGWRQGVPPLHTWGEAREGEGWRQGNPHALAFGGKQGRQKAARDELSSLFICAPSAPLRVQSTFQSCFRPLSMLRKVPYG